MTHVTTTASTTIAAAASRLRAGTRSTVDLVEASLRGDRRASTPTRTRSSASTRRGARAAARARRRRARAGPRSRAAARHPDLAEGSDRRRRPVDDRGVARARRSRSRRPTRRSSRGCARPARSCIGKTNLHEFALGTTSEDSAFGAGAPSARSDAIGRRIERRLGRGGRDRHGPRVDRHRHRRVDPDSRRRLRHRRTQAVVRRSADRRRDSAELVARPRRPARAHRRRTPRWLWAVLAGRADRRRSTGDRIRRRSSLRAR